MSGLPLGLTEQVKGNGDFLQLRQLTKQTGRKLKWEA